MARGTRAKVEIMRQDAVTLRQAGATFLEIGEQLGVSRSRAHQLYVEALQRYKEETDAAVEDLLALELSRLDSLLVAVTDRAMAGDPKSVNAALQIMDKRLKIYDMLGYAKPQKLALTNPDGTEEWRGTSMEQRWERLLDFKEEALKRKDQDQ